MLNIDSYEYIEIMNFIINNLDFSKTKTTKENYKSYCTKIILSKKYGSHTCKTILLLIPLLDYFDNLKINKNCEKSKYFELFVTIDNKDIIINFHVINYRELLYFFKHFKNYEKTFDLFLTNMSLYSFKLMNNSYYNKEALKMQIKLNKKS